MRAIEGRSQWRLTWRRLRGDKVAVASAVVIVIMAALAIAAPAFAALTGHGPAQQFPNTGISATGVPVGPGKQFWLGADELGRDLFVRILYGARISLFVGVVTTAIGTVARRGHRDDGRLLTAAGSTRSCPGSPTPCWPSRTSFSGSRSPWCSGRACRW